MDFKEEFNKLVKVIKSVYLKRGEKVTNAQIADRLTYNKDYFNTLTGRSGKVTEDHVSHLRMAYQKELLEATGVKAGDKLNPERAIMLALLEDYAEWKAESTGQSFEDVKAELKKRGGRILGGLDSWMPE